MRQIFQAAVLVCLFTISVPMPKVFGQDYIPIFSSDYSSRLSVEVDPVTFLLKGYSFHVRYQPMFSERLLVGVGTYALDVPQPIVDFNVQNRDLGWDVRIRGAFFVTGEFFPHKANEGWFIGEQIGFQSYKISNFREARGSTTFNALLLMTYLGYSWHPFEGSLYIKPWVGLGYLTKVDGVRDLNSLRYAVGPLFPFLTFHVGYTF